jgi:hypothetical protein
MHERVKDLNCTQLCTIGYLSLDTGMRVFFCFNFFVHNSPPELYTNSSDCDTLLLILYYEYFDANTLLIKLYC